MELSLLHGEWEERLVKHCILLYLTLTFHQDFTFPENVAYPFGGEGAPEYIVMQIHYDNPHEIKGRLAFIIYCITLKMQIYSKHDIVPLTFQALWTALV